MTAPVVLAAYDPDWPRRFAEERVALAAIFTGADIHIEHIGSTAVPGLAAKPIIDILIGVPTLADADQRVTALEAIGYQYVASYEAELPHRRYFRKPRTVHLHCVLKDGDHWNSHLAFRDYLRSHPTTARAYEAMKRDLAGRLCKDEYTAAKAPFIARVLAAASKKDV